MRCGANTYAVNKVTKMKRPGTLAEVARRVNAGDAFDRRLSEFLDEFYAHPARRQAMIEVPPPALADARQPATLGGVAEYLARRWDLGVPPWTNDPSRFLHEPYFTTAIEDLKALLLVQS